LWEKFLSNLLFLPGIFNFLKDILNVMKLSRHLSKKNRGKVKVSVTTESKANKLRSEKKSN
jgi:hypothetical protein